MAHHRGYYGADREQYMAHNEQSTLHKVQETYWTTKQYVKKKLGKKEDAHVVASDSELDAKLEVFKAIQKSSLDLLRAIERYQERLLIVSQEENAMGRFLKGHSQRDKTRAGKIMAAVGKVQSQSSQQRMSLRVPLVRLYQEVETFRYRAISDTLMTVNRMEVARTEYRGALMWMKDVSDELDPDTYKQLEKFRKVQAQVKKTKVRFDKLKLDVMQKIDLLAASRCNMFSHVLASYQSTLLQFWEKAAHTHTAVAEAFKGYQYFEFNMLKELKEPSKELADQTNGGEELPVDGLISLDDKSQDGSSPELKRKLSDSMNNLYQGDGASPRPPNKQQVAASNMEGLAPFIDLGIEVEEDDESLEEIKRRQDEELDITGKTLLSSKQRGEKDKGSKDLLFDEPDISDTADNLTLLNDLLDTSSASETELSREWQAVFGTHLLSPSSSATGLTEPTPGSFMPSSLLDIKHGLAGLNLGGTPQQLPPPTQQLPKGSKNVKPNLSAWFNLFADLDPLANPDAIGRKPDDSGNAA